MREFFTRVSDPDPMMSRSVDRVLRTTAKDSTPVRIPLRLLQLLFIFFVASVLVCSCAGQGGQDAAPTGTTQPAAEEPKTQAPDTQPLVSVSDDEVPADTALLAGDFAKAFSIYSDLLFRNANGPSAEYYFARMLDTASRSGLDMTQQVAETARRIVAGSANHELIARARAALIADRLRAGDHAAAVTEAAGMWFVPVWNVIGPFENEGEAGFDAAEPPEREVKQDAEYKGKQGMNRWFVPTARPVYGYVDLGAILRLDENVFAYAAVFVHSPLDADGALHIGTDGAVKVWLNKKLVHKNDAYRNFALDQDVVRVKLRKGWNYLLVKSCQKRGPWRFAVRVTDPNGANLPDLRFEPVHEKLSEPWSEPAEAAASIDAPNVHGACLAHLDGLAAGNPNLLPARMQRAFLLAARSVLDENDRFVRDELRTVCAKAVRNGRDGKPYAPYLLLLASQEERRNGKLEALRIALAQEPGSPVLNYEMSLLYSPTREATEWEAARSRRGRLFEDEYSRQSEKVSIPMEAREKELLELALAGRIDAQPAAGQDATAQTPPPFVPALKALAELYFRRGGAWVFEGQRILAIARTTNPKDIAILQKSDSLRPALPPQRVSQLEGYLAIDFTNAVARNELVLYYRTLGRYDEAVAELRKRLLIDPYDFDALLNIAQIFDSLDEPGKALAAVKEALEISPENHGIFASLGHFQVRLGMPEEAKQAWTKSLAILPSQPELEKRLKFLTSGGLVAQPSVEAEFWKGYEENLAPHIEAAMDAGNDARFGSATAAFLLKHDLVWLNPNGTSRTFSQRVLKILTEKAAREFQVISAFPRGLDYYSQFKAEVKQARLIKPDGTIIEGVWKQDSAGAYFQKVDKGDIIVFECQLQEEGDPRYKGYFGLMLPLQVGSLNSQGANWTEKSKVTLIHPTEKPVYFHEVRCAPKTASIQKDDLTIKVWEVASLPEVDMEPHMPPFFEVVPYVHFSTFRTWDEVAEWYWGICKDQFESSDQIREAVRTATAGLESPRDKIPAIFQKLVADVRYEALKLSDHSYRPFKASHTYARKLGDCKDVATLLSVMLAEAGIEAEFALVRALDGFTGRVDLSLPSMRIFNHAIAYVPPPPGHENIPGLFLDATARYYGAMDLPGMDQGAVAFVMKKGGTSGRGVVIPHMPPEANLTQQTADVEIGPDGNAKRELHATVCGLAAGEIRATYQEGTRRKEVFEKRMARFFPGCEVVDVRFSDLTNYNAPVTYSAIINVPNFARKEGRALSFSLTPIRLNLTRAFAQLETRKHELVMDQLYRLELQSRYKLPSGYALVNPDRIVCDTSLNCKGAEYSMKRTFDVANRLLTVSVRFTVTEPRIAQGDYPDFRKFCVDIDKLEDEEAVLEAK
ncbi:MAG: DUF3857 domain-containing protein [Planctomycetota bacterium]|nr:DUF3857 domain-containing protein [Planctomycetota bacterium]